MSIRPELITKMKDETEHLRQDARRSKLSQYETNSIVASQIDDLLKKRRIIVKSIIECESEWEYEQLMEKSLTELKAMRQSHCDKLMITPYEMASTEGKHPNACDLIYYITEYVSQLNYNISKESIVSMIGCGHMWFRITEDEETVISFVKSALNEEQRVKSVCPHANLSDIAYVCGNRDF